MHYMHSWLAQLLPVENVPELPDWAFPHAVTQWDAVPNKLKMALAQEATERRLEQPVRAFLQSSGNDRFDVSTLPVLSGARPPQTVAESALLRYLEWHPMVAQDAWHALACQEPTLRTLKDLLLLTNALSLQLNTTCVSCIAFAQGLVALAADTGLADDASTLTVVKHSKELADLIKAEGRHKIVAAFSGPFMKETSVRQYLLSLALQPSLVAGLSASQKLRLLSVLNTTGLPQFSSATRERASQDWHQAVVNAVQIVMCS